MLPTHMPLQHVLPSAGQRRQRSCRVKASCTWYRAFGQLQCVTCTREQLSLKLRRKLFVELDIWSFSWARQGETLKRNALMRSGRLRAPPGNEQLLNLKFFFPLTFHRWAWEGGIRAGNLWLISRGTMLRIQHRVSPVKIANWGRRSALFQSTQGSLLSPLLLAGGPFSQPPTSTSPSTLRSVTALLEELCSYFSCLPALLLSHQLHCAGREAELSLQVLLNSASSSADTQPHNR